MQTHSNRAVLLVFITILLRYVIGVKRTIFIDRYHEDCDSVVLLDSMLLIVLVNYIVCKTQKTEDGATVYTILLLCSPPWLHLKGANIYKMTRLCDGYDNDKNNTPCNSN